MRRFVKRWMSLPWVRRSSPLQQGQVLVLLTSKVSLASKSLPQMSQEVSSWMLSVGVIVSPLGRRCGAPLASGGGAPIRRSGAAAVELPSEADGVTEQARSALARRLPTEVTERGCAAVPRRNNVPCAHPA